VLDDILLRNIQGEVDSQSEVAGRVEIQSGSRIISSVVRGPVSIGKGCTIRDSFIGPFTSIADQTTIEKSSVEHSVILENCSIYQIERLVDSVVGRGSRVKKQPNSFSAVRLFVGDDSNLEL
jgi:glucose-1-phosphate thymidylyltransferase